MRRLARNDLRSLQTKGRKDTAKTSQVRLGPATASPSNQNSPTCQSCPIDRDSNRSLSFQKDITLQHHRKKKKTNKWRTFSINLKIDRKGSFLAQMFTSMYAAIIVGSYLVADHNDSRRFASCFLATEIKTDKE